MSEKEVKGYVEAAEKAHQAKKNEQLEKLVKEIVQETLEKVERLEEQIKELQEQKRQLKMTIDDLRDGKMELLKERLEKDKRASDVVRIKLVEVYQPITINYPTVNPWRQPWTVWYGSNTSGNVQCCGTTSEISNAVNGTYCLTSGSTVTLR